MLVDFYWAFYPEIHCEKVEIEVVEVEWFLHPDYT
jgi:hypothetical protein